MEGALVTVMPQTVTTFQNLNDMSNHGIKK